MIKLAIAGLILWALGRARRPRPPTGGTVPGGFAGGDSVPPDPPSGLVPVGGLLVPGGGGLSPLVAETPTPGSLYRIRAGDPSPFALVGKAYGLPSGSARVAALRTLTRHPWNRTLYGIPWPHPELPNTPSYAASEGIVITGAWLPRWSDPIASTPRKPVLHPETGKIIPHGSRYGTIYFPPIDTPALMPPAMEAALAKVQ